MRAGVPYDAEIGYLESTGTQWIDTLFTATGGCVMEFRFFTADCGVYSSPMGSHSTISTNYYNRNAVILNAVNKVSFSKCEKYGVINLGNNVDLSTDFHTYRFDSRGYNRIGLVDGTEVVNELTEGVLAPDSTVLMWKYDWNGNIVSGKFAWARVQNANGELVRDFIPVRVGSGANAVGYMYDRVTRKLFGNKGTGSFVLGPDVATPVMGLHRYAERSVA